ncbi:mitogen-activated protein kinase 5 [Perkinsela sp. CCAP 1560/4]|nr:mitogen-activated protein kinase 5 [Perkinsela sp. CCAP 1560/4]|eukprot:KNH06063.1 mitogen-activated protein kinase 5 [Perkinsela sp. CCAP 1560/4]
MSFEAEEHITRKYELVQKIGKGAYGHVWKAVDRRSKKIIAVKKIFDAFQNATDAQRTFREVMFLQKFRHENIIKLLRVHRAENNLDLYLIFEFMETDLHSVIRAHILEDVHKQFVAYQLVKTILYLHSGSLLHRDLKPSNILLDAACVIKVADFGLARSVLSNEEDKENTTYTDYVATRWYRAPEILMGSTLYTFGIDMWSVGCITGEMILGKPLFPGTSTPNQLERIIAMLGEPTKEDIRSFESPYAEGLLANLSKFQSKTFEETFRGVDPNAADFIRNLLHFNPDKRMSARQALRHPYIRPFRNRKEEKICSDPILIPLSDNTKYAVSEYRDFLYADITKRSPPVIEPKPTKSTLRRTSLYTTMKSQVPKTAYRTSSTSQVAPERPAHGTGNIYLSKTQPSTSSSKLNERMSNMTINDKLRDRERDPNLSRGASNSKVDLRPRFH